MTSIAKVGMRQIKSHLCIFMRGKSICVSQVSSCHDSAEVTLTFWRRAQHCCLVAMATVAGDERPAPAVTQGVLIPAATQTLVVEEAGARAELRVLQRRANVTVQKQGRHQRGQMYSRTT